MTFVYDTDQYVVWGALAAYATLPIYMNLCFKAKLRSANLAAALDSLARLAQYQQVLAFKQAFGMPNTESKIGWVIACQDHIKIYMAPEKGRSAVALAILLTQQYDLRDQIIRELHGVYDGDN